MNLGSVVVVGASRGLGQEIARTYLERGRPVVGFGRSMHLGDSDIRVESVDIRDADACEAIEACYRSLRGPRLTVVTAALLGPVGGLSQTDSVRWTDTVMTNLVGAANVLRVVGRQALSNDRVVVFMGGGVGGPNPQTRVTAYTASKAGIALLLEDLASDEDFKAPIVGLAPGAFPTGFADEVVEVGVEIAGRELWDQVNATHEKALDVSAIMATLDFIESPRGALLNGRIVSAQRDNLEEIVELCARSSDALRLRRVDERSVRVVKPW